MNNQNGIQIPIFSSATQQNQSDDFIDFSEFLYDLTKENDDTNTSCQQNTNSMIALYRNEAIVAASLAKQYATAAVSLAQPRNENYNAPMGLQQPSLPALIPTQFQSMFPEAQHQSPQQIVNQIRYGQEGPANKRHKGMQAPPAVLINQHIQQQKQQTYVMSNNHNNLPQSKNMVISSPNIDMLLQSSQKQYSISNMVDMDMNNEHNDITKRRERNRVHAKQSRVRKKFFLESLQQQVSSLQDENWKLRTIIQQKMPDKAERILKTCFNPSDVFSHAFTSTENSLAKEGISAPKSKKLHPFDQKLISSLTYGQRSIIVTNPNEHDNPICFASQGFYDLTGYTKSEVIGKNCRFLQGPRTSKQSTNIIKVALESGNDVNVCILNYKKDGTPFWNQLFIGVLRDWNNHVVNCIGVLCEVKPQDANSIIEDMVNFVMPLPETMLEKEQEERVKFLS